MELASQGHSQREIASKLQVDVNAVNRDIQFLKHKAQENLQKHIHETIPQEYQHSLTGINQVLKIVWGMINNNNGDLESKTKLQALALINDCNKYKMDLATGSAICNEAIKFVTQRKEQLEKLEMVQKIDERTEDRKEEEEKGEEEEDKTTSGVF